MLDKILFYLFAVLFFLTPLFWLPTNYELFEFNKMLLVYFLTIAITGVWILKAIKQKSFNLKITPLTIPILLFLAANVLSTVFSIDKHISIWGYYSRSNGGLLSLISYILLFLALVSNFEKEKVIKLLKMAVWGGVAVSLWAIPEHFGVSPSCVVLHGQFRADCWIQDVQARVFATLGQPNWLAAYLAMLIFPAIYFFLTEPKQKLKIGYFVGLILMYLAFTFTFSRGAALGLLAGLGIFGIFLFVKNELFVAPVKNHLAPVLDFKKSFIWVILTFLIINIIYGSALVRFKLTALLPQDPTPKVQQVVSGQGTQLENGGTESGQIRLIVWQGALDIFKAYPILGSGPETFAYSYYKFRPAAHNLVSEWDFLYNKAHNEFLNYLANTGLVGFASYMFMIMAFIFWSVKFVLNNKNKEQLQTNLLIICILAAYVSYLVQNFFGFSVVVIAVFFFLFPAISFILAEKTKPYKLPQLLSFIYYRPIYAKAASVITVLAILFFGYQVVNFWYADTIFAKGNRASEVGNPGRAYNELYRAVSLRGFDPLYRNELGYAAASAALAYEETDATLSADLKDEGAYETELSLKVSPNNLSLWRTAVRTYFSLSLLDESYNEKLLQAVDKTIDLAPTDPKLYYNKGLIMQQLDRTEEAEVAYKKAVELKPNYREGFLALGLFYHDQKDYDKAMENMNIVLRLIPNDPEVIENLVKWGEEGIATESAEIKPVL